MQWKLSAAHRHHHHQRWWFSSKLSAECFFVCVIRNGEFNCRTFLMELNKKTTKRKQTNRNNEIDLFLHSSMKWKTTSEINLSRLQSTIIENNQLLWIFFNISSRIDSIEFRILSFIVIHFDGRFSFWWTRDGWVRALHTKYNTVRYGRSPKSSSQDRCIPYSDMKGGQYNSLEENKRFCQLDAISLICFANKSFYSNDLKSTRIGILAEWKRKTKKAHTPAIPYPMRRLLEKIQLLCHYFPLKKLFHFTVATTTTTTTKIVMKSKKNRPANTIKFYFLARIAVNNADKTMARQVTI